MQTDHYSAQMRLLAKSKQSIKQSRPYGALTALSDGMD